MAASPHESGALQAGEDPPTRLESDSLGTVAVPAEHLWGAQTQRSLRYFAFGEPMPPPIIRAFGQLKAACAEVNGAMGRLEPALQAQQQYRVDLFEAHPTDPTAPCGKTFARLSCAELGVLDGG